MSYTKLKKLSRVAVIKGNGSSLWGQSSDSYRIDSYRVYEFGKKDNCDEDMVGRPYELQLFGPKPVEWVQYTDRAIEKEVNRRFLKLVQKLYPKYVIKYITWSEQGMQPSNGWSFDIIKK